MALGESCDYSDDGGLVYHNKRYSDQDESDLVQWMRIKTRFKMNRGLPEKKVHVNPAWGAIQSFYLEVFGEDHPGVDERRIFCKRVMEWVKGDLQELENLLAFIGQNKDDVLKLLKVDRITLNVLATKGYFSRLLTAYKMGYVYKSKKAKEGAPESEHFSRRYKENECKVDDATKPRLKFRKS